MAKKKKRAGKARTASSKRGRAKTAGATRSSRAGGDAELRKQLADFLGSGHAHVSWKKGLADVPEHIRTVKPSGSPHSLWDLLEHMRIAQWDILEFSRDARHVSPDWPAGYWPSANASPSDKDWSKSLREFERDMNAMKDLILDPKTDLYCKIPHGSGQTILREALLIADHNSYHLGEFVLLRRMLNAWPAD